MELVIFWVGLLLIVFCYMSLWFALSIYARRLDVVDSAWGLGFVLVAWIALLLRSNFGAVQSVSAILVSLWGLRLFAHISNRNARRNEDDHRYQVLQAGWGKAKHRKAYLNIFLLQGLLLTAISTPVIALAFAHRAGQRAHLGRLVRVVVRYRLRGSGRPPVGDIYCAPPERFA
ncbi:MAG: DUF1295 domain-containing protein [Candidatus Saccharibacteria bacterium]